MKSMQQQDAMLEEEKEEEYNVKKQTNIINLISIF